MKKLIFGILLVMHTNGSTASRFFLGKPTGCLQADILFIADWSGSLEDKESQMAGAIAGFSNRFSLAPDGVKIGIMTFTSEPKQYIGITDNSAAVQSAAGQLANTRASGGSTLGPALSLSPSLFAASQAERTTEALRFIVLITDGQLDDSFLCRDIADSLKSEGIIICAIAMGGLTVYSEQLLHSLVSPGYMFYSSYEAISETLLVLDVCG